LTNAGGESGATERVNGLRVSSEPDAPFDLLKVLGEGNNEFNMAATGFRDYRPVALLLRDDAGVIRGGIWGWVWAQWLYVANLFVEERVRGRGWGAQLLAAAEDEARLAGARNAYLETYSFQARPFYEARGYEVTGEIKDLPPGGVYYVMRKAL
jgi:GNAT superfamily N-acetyltransferase